MIVICEECGQKYELDPSIMTRRKAKIKCKSCNFLINIYNPESIKDVTAEDLMYPSEKQVRAQDLTQSTASKSSSAPSMPAIKAGASQRRHIGIGLRGQLILFFLTPLTLVLAVGGYFFVRQMDALGNTMADESLRMLTSVSENEVTEYSKAVSQQIQIYLTNHPDLKKEKFNDDVDFKKIAIQRISLTMRGTTSLYEPTVDGKQVFWAHANPDYIGRDMDSLQASFGKGFNEFMKIIRNGRSGKESSGRYTQGTVSRPQDIFMVCTPVKGTPYYVSCSTYLSESTNVMDVPMSPLFKIYLEMEAWRPLGNEWWKKK
ncbi:MAG: hypothetical protein EHM45_09225 [Desulfobacteraceae bacterium]|nr:MAG: hypothetical protein EHM45_09225 [Desulfobacteraceae bacterium]